MVEEEEHKGKTNSNLPIGPYEAVCDVLHYLIYGKRNRTAKVGYEGCQSAGKSGKGEQVGYHDWGLCRTDMLC